MNFDLNLCRLLAYSSVFFSRQDWEPVADAIGNDPKAPDVGRSTRESLEAWIAAFPRLTSEIRDAVPRLARADLTAREITAPGELGLMQQYGPAFATIANQIDAANKLAGSQGDVAVLEGPGSRAADAALDISRRADPEFYRLRGEEANVLSEILNNPLTTAEEEAISRQLARENARAGLLGTPTSTNTVANAMTFGQAARNRQLQGIQATTSFLPASRSGFDPVQIALGRPSIASVGSKFGDTGGAGGQAGQLGGGLLGQVGGFQQSAMDINSQRRDVLDRANETGTAIGSVVDV